MIQSGSIENHKSTIWLTFYVSTWLNAGVIGLIYDFFIHSHGVLDHLLAGRFLNSNRKKIGYSFVKVCVVDQRETF